MCGIAGELDLSRSCGEPELRDRAQSMIATLRHRGPDDEGVWVDAEAGIALGSRRLAILDLSPAGHQPMISSSGRYVVTFNGEIYNYLELRRELETQVADSALALHGHGDTEVMLAAFEHWGVEAALPRLNGMFAFALWDRRERVLYLALDRFGEKPLYYGWMGNVLLFGSELKALRAHPLFRGEIGREAVAFHLRYSYVPAPVSIYKGIAKLSPATCLKILGDRKEEAVPVAYWSLRQVAERGLAEPYRGSETEAAEELDALLRDAIRLRMLSDVPLGAFLSGGIDSSTVVALMQAQSSRRVRTFSIGFHEDDYNEARHAHAVARHLRTEHTELYVTPREAMDVIPLLPALYDEPFADSSQIPTFLVSKLARHSVTVSLSGDGGDEVFGGYQRYFWGRRIWNRIRLTPGPLRRLAARSITGVSPRFWDALFQGVGPILRQDWRQRLPGDKLHKLAGVLRLKSPQAVYLRLVAQWLEPDAMVPGASGSASAEFLLQQWPDFPQFEQSAMYLDAVNYLPDDILVKVDRASMGVSLEGRIPYLDPRVVEFAWKLPLAMKIRNGQGKQILRRVLHRYVPRELVERPKMGFGIPIGAWMRGPLRDWAEALLDEHRLRQEGFFDPRPIRRKWQEHLSGNHNWQYALWNVLMFQAWLGQSGSDTVRAGTKVVEAATGKP
jgi:asparagine synthase (glutamine-hydrolysing)